MDSIDWRHGLIHTIRVSRLLRVIYTCIAIALFLGIPFLQFSNNLLHTHAQAADWTKAKNFGTDLDECEKGSMSANCYGENFSYINLKANSYMIFCPVGPDQCTNNPATAMERNKHTALGNIASAIDAMYTHPPANLAYWMRDTASSLGFMPKQVYAQGVGFRGLEPLLPIWKAFRNISYIILALAMVVVGFMVMMRKKIDPKTVVTVQNSLPRIVIALLLITFSYAIVGFMIDLMYLLIGFINVLISTALPATNPSDPLQPTNFFNMGFWRFWISVFRPIRYSMFGPGVNLVDDIEGGEVWSAIGDFIGGGLLVASGVGPLFQFILFLAFLFAFVRLLFMLLTSYTQIILAVLTGPIQILIDVFPGANGFNSWIKGLVSNLSVFPITILLLMVGNVIGQYMQDGGSLWVPPMLPQGAGLGGLAQSLISLGIILSIPNIANSVKEAMKTQSIIEASPSGIFGPLGRGAGTAMQGAFQLSMIAQAAKSFGLGGSGHDEHGGK